MSKEMPVQRVNFISRQVRKMFGQDVTLFKAIEQKAIKV